MVHFIGAGPGAPDLITVRGQKLLSEADVIIYAGSLVNPALLDLKKKQLRGIQQCNDDTGAGNRCYERCRKQRSYGGKTSYRRSVSVWCNP